MTAPALGSVTSETSDGVLLVSVPLMDGAEVVGTVEIEWDPATNETSLTAAGLYLTSAWGTH